MHVYLITNLVNGKMYVGKTTKSMEDRWKEHLKNSKKGVPYRLYQAIRKYGPTAFAVESLTTCDSQERLNEMEKMWIILLDAQRSGYNMTVGGDGHPSACTKEIRTKISNAMRGHPCSQKTKDSASYTFKGIPKPLAQRQKMSEAWNDDRRGKQAEVARRVNAVENKKLKDYTCLNCGKKFRQVTKGMYGGHRKACLFWHPENLENPVKAVLP